MMKFVKRLRQIWDTLSPRAETLQIILESPREQRGLYSDDKREVRSPNLDPVKR